MDIARMQMRGKGVVKSRLLMRMRHRRKSGIRSFLMEMKTGWMDELLRTSFLARLGDNRAKRGEDVVEFAGFAPNFEFGAKFRTKIWGQISNK
jgi:hypothetical protein